MPYSNPLGIQPTPLYGFKQAKAGFDVKTATDYELLFSSGWPSIAIAYTVVVTFPGGGGVGHVPNPLGFPALTMAWASVDGVVMYRVFPNVSDNFFYFTDIDAVNTVYYLQAYNLDISQQVAYNFIPPPPIQIGKYDPNYGIKFAKPGKSINSSNLNDFIFHSKAMSPAILNVNTTLDTVPAVVGTQTITTPNPNGYVPWAFGYAVDNTGIWTFAPPYAQSPPSLFVNLVELNSFTLSFDPVLWVGGSLIMLRDPLFVADTVSVTY